MNIFAQSPSPNFITHVTVVDVVSGAEAKNQTIELRGSKIAAVSEGSTQFGKDATIVDAQGRFLIPGLWDMHVHVHSIQELPLFVANGVTGIRIMAGQKDTQAFRAELARQTLSPEIYLASAIVDGPNPTWPDSIVIKKPEDARKEVDAIKAGGADFIKVYDGIPRNAYFALADEAKKQSIPFAGHLPEQVTAQEASAAGQRSMEHLKGIAMGCSTRGTMLGPEVVRAQYPRQKFILEAEAFRSFDPAQCHALFDEFRLNDTWQVPTLTVNRMWGHLDDRGLTNDPRLQYVDKKSRKRWEERTSQQIQRWGQADYGLARGVFAADEKLVDMMFHSGVPMMAGTDAMNPFILPGFSLHEELTLLTEAGLPPLVSLQAATVNPARFLDRTEDEGTVTVGKVANLVLLDADPLADISNTTRIRAVWMEGHYYDRQALDQILEAAKEEAGR